MHDFKKDYNTSLSPGSGQVCDKLDAIDWSRVKSIILDLDGVFYPETYTHNSNFNWFMTQSIRDLARKRGRNIPLSNEDLVELGLKSYETHGHSVFGFQNYLESLYPGEFDLFGNDYKIMHHLIYDAHTDFAVKNTGYFENCLERQKFFNNLSRFGHDKVAILSHGSKDWARTVVASLNLNHIFNNDNIFGLECVGYKKKTDSPAPFQHVCEKMKIDCTDVLFIDNTAVNHFYPNKLGMQTIWIQGEEQPFTTLPNYISAQKKDLADVYTSHRQWGKRGQPNF